MAIATYADVLAAVPDWLTRSDTTTSLIESWIALAEARISRTLRINRMLTRATDTISTEFRATPTDMVGMRSMRLTASPYLMLDFLSPEQMADYRMTQPTGTMTSYARIGQEFWFAPTPAAAVGIEVIYYAKVPALTSTVTTTWLLTSSPDLYLYGACLEATLYYEDDEGAAKWSGLFDRAIDAVQKADLRDAQAANLTRTLVGTTYA